MNANNENLNNDNVNVEQVQEPVDSKVEPHFVPEDQQVTKTQPILQNGKVHTKPILRNAAIGVLASVALVMSFLAGYVVNDAIPPQQCQLAIERNVPARRLIDLAAVHPEFFAFQPDRLEAILPMLPPIPTIATKDTPKAVVVTANLPAIKAENVKVRIQGRELLINANQEKDKCVNAGKNAEEQCNMTTFQATLPLPRNIQSDKMQTNMKDGVLTISIPKT